MKLRNICSLLILAGVSFIGCKDDATTETPEGDHTHTGAATSIGAGSATGFITMSGSDEPLAIGIKFDSAALNFGDTNSRMFTVALPDDAKEVTAFDHIGFDWNPIGHEPTMFYGLPHFDIHFYTMPVAEQVLIAGDSMTISPDPSYVPANYVGGADPVTHVPIGVPTMGWHFVDVTSPEFNGVPFTSTFIYGYNKGNLAFMEPMITRAFLSSHKDTTYTIPQPAKWATTGKWYPTKYGIKYDAATKMSTVSMTDFIKH